MDDDDDENPAFFGFRLALFGYFWYPYPIPVLMFIHQAYSNRDFIVRWD